MSRPLITHHISHITPSHITPHTSFITALLLITPLVTAISHNTYHTPCRSHITQHSSPGFRVAGAVHRAVWQSCGASGRRLARGWLSCGRRSTQSLLPAWLPPGLQLAFVWQTQHTGPSGGAAARVVAAWPAAGFRVAGAAHRAFWRSCGARGRRLARGWLSCGTRSTQSLLEELRRAWSPPGPRLAFVWQAQHTEPSGGGAARVVATWPAAGFRVAGAAHRAFWRSCGVRGRRLARGWLSCGRCTTQSFQSLLVVAWSAAGFRVAGALHRASWRSCGARGRRLARGWLSCGRRSTESLLEELRRAWSPPGPRLAFAWQAEHTEPAGGAARVVAAWPAAGFRVAGAAHRAFWRSCGARGRRLARGWLSCGRRSTQSFWRSCGARGCRLAFGWLSCGRRAFDFCEKGAPSFTRHFVTNHL